MSNILTLKQYLASKPELSTLSPEQVAELLNTELVEVVQEVPHVELRRVALNNGTVLKLNETILSVGGNTATRAAAQTLKEILLSESIGTGITTTDAGFVQLVDALQSAAVLTKTQSDELKNASRKRITRAQELGFEVVFPANIRHARSLSVVGVL